MKIKTKLILAVIIIILIAAAWTWFTQFAGRSASRLLGADSAQVLRINNEAKDGLISVSFDKQGKSTVKDVTFLATDGYIYTQEFKDVSPLEGIIRWVPYGEDDSLVQSRAISRWTGKAVNLKLPKNCEKVLSIDIGYASKDKRVKNVLCKMPDQSYLVKEYREGFIDRGFEGYLKINPKPKQKQTEETK